MVKIVNDLKNLFFPPFCLGCGNTVTRAEEKICVQCRHQIPFTHFTSRPRNPVERLFEARCELHAGTALFWYNENSLSQKLIHQLKYRRQKHLSAVFGEWLGIEMAASGRFSEVSLVIPVPLHPKRMKKRKFNQCEGFSKALAFHLKCDYADHLLLRKGSLTSQTRKNRASRDLVTHSPFAIQPSESLRNQHILLADDVLTTGSTLESCARLLQKEYSCTISIATMGVTA